MKSCRSCTDFGPPFSLGQKVVPQRFYDPRVVLSKPFDYLPVPELGLFVVCELLVLLALGVEGMMIILLLFFQKQNLLLVTWDRIERSCVSHMCLLKCSSRSESSMCS